MYKYYVHTRNKQKYTYIQETHTDRRACKDHTQKCAYTCEEHIQRNVHECMHAHSLYIDTINNINISRYT